MTLARYREWLTCSSLRARLTREIVHLLAASPRSHSELGELLPSTLSGDQTEIDAVLRDVAAYTPPRGLDDAGAYALAPGAWRSFDPFFHRYAPSELDAALQNATRAWCAARKSTADETARRVASSRRASTAAASAASVRRRDEVPTTRVDGGVLSRLRVRAGAVGGRLRSPGRRALRHGARRARPRRGRRRRVGAPTHPRVRLRLDIGP